MRFDVAPMPGAGGARRLDLAVGGVSFPCVVRKAVISDVEAIQRLIQRFARANQMLSRGPQYIYENLRDFLVAVIENPAPSGRPESGPYVVGCGSLHVLWADQAEIRSLAVLPEYQGQKLGKLIVALLVDEARSLGLKKVYAFTLEEGFFRGLGFEPKQREALPSKLWSECSHCPKYFSCDEIGLALEILP